VKKIEEILIQCIEDIKAGKASLVDCLGHYPDMRWELEPLLRIALSIKEPTDISPSDAFKIRAKINLMEHIHASQSGKRAPKSLSQASVRHGWYAGWARAVAIVVAVILFISAAGTGTAYASQSSLPGDALYPVKLSTEQFQRVITLDDATEVELELKFADTRLEEIEAIADKRPDRIAIAIAGYERNLNLAITKAEQIGDSETSRETVALEILDHLTRLDEIEDSVPEAARESVIDSKEIAINGHIKALQNLTKLNPVRATEINLEAIQGRLNRAKVESERGNAREMERTLQHFQRLRRFGEEMSEDTRRRGYDTRAIDEINARATAGQMQILGSIYDNAPEGTKGAVEEAIKASGKGHEQAVKGLRQQGSIDDIPEEPTLPEEIPDDIKGKILNPEPDGPINDSGEPGDGSGEPGNGPRDSGDDSEEPGNGSGEPGEHGDGSGEPGNGPRDSGDDSEEPGDGSEEPGNGPGDSGGGKH